MKTKILVLLFFATICGASLAQTNIPESAPPPATAPATEPEKTAPAEPPPAAPVTNSAAVETPPATPVPDSAPAETPAPAPVATPAAVEVPTPAPIATPPAVETPTPAPIATPPAVETPTPAPIATPPAVETPTPTPATTPAVEAPVPVPVAPPSAVENSSPGPATPPAAPDNSTPAPVAAETTGPAATNAPSVSTNATSAPSVSTNVVPLADEVIPVIRFDALTTLPEAVRTLAKQAGINFQFDPAILNQIGADGRPVPQPQVEIYWENVTPMQALSALLENYKWQIVQDPKTKIARITQKDPQALEPLVTRVIQLKYSNPTNIIIAVTNTFVDKRSKLIADPRTSQLIVVATEKELPGVAELIEKLDGATKEILIEAILTETTRSPSTIKGIDWTKTLEAQNFSFGNGTTTGSASSSTTTTTPGDTTTSTTPGSRPLSSTAGSKTVTSMGQSLTTALGAGGLSVNTAKGLHPATAFLNADGVHAVLSFLNSDADTESISLPRSVAMDGVKTELAVVRNIPIFEQEQSANSTGGNLATVKPNYDKEVKGTILNEVGVKLAVTPRIVGLTNVHLFLKPEISAQEAVAAHAKLNGQDNEAPIFNRRLITTEATVPSGFTLVLGGLNNDITSKSFSKVPILGDLPGIGLAFRHDSKQRTKQNLLIFVTPTIVGDTDFQKNKTDFLKNKFVPKVETEESLWDTGRPVDWTKPGPNVEPVYSPKSIK